MDVKALQFNIRHSFSPNALGYCGKNTAQERYRRCLQDNVCEGIEQEIKGFIVLNPYLQAIGRITGRPPFSYKVAECYWFGNELLSQIQNDDYGILLHEFSKQGVPVWLIDELKLKKPKKFIPTHLFQVLHIGVGRASGSVPFNLESIHNCMIRWGTVTKITKGSSAVKLHSLQQGSSKYSLMIREEIVAVNPVLTPSVSVGDIVTVHWGTVNSIIDQLQVERLEYWTDEVLANHKSTIPMLIASD